jgi:hypothetical protein
MGVFQDKVKAHMEEYNGQNNELVDKKGGAWKGKGSFAHILRDSQNDWMFNLLLPYREVGSLVQDIRKGVIKKHMYAHHLNSSQMMCMNFFYPLMIEDRLDIILKAINSKIKWGKPVALFEFNSPMEVGKAAELNKEKLFGEPTNFDFFITTSNGYRVYFEIKYTEAEFGAPEKKNSSYPQKYYDKFEVYKSLIPSCFKDEYKANADYFLDHYQLMRNLIHIQSSNDFVVFLVPDKDLVPENNQPIISAAEEIKDKVLISHQDNCIVFGWNKLFTCVEKKVKNNEKLNKYYAEFKKKYLDL